MNRGKLIRDDTKVSLEVALDMAGFGLYSYLLTCLTSLIVISYVCVAFGKMIYIPASRCELDTTNAQQGHIAAWPLVGIILGGLLSGHLGDKYGRRRMLFFTLVSAAIVNGLCSIAVDWLMLLLLQSVAAFCASGQYTLSLTLLSESVPMGKRNLVILLANSMFLLSVGIMAVIAIPIIPLPFSIYLPALDIYWNSWRTVLLVFSAPSLLSALLLYFVMESPKYVFTKGREEEAINIIKRIHRLNNGKSAGELKINNISLDTWQLNGPPSAKDQIIPLFKMPLVKYTAIMTALMVLQPFGAFTVWLPTITNQFVQIVETGVGVEKSLCEILNDSLVAPVNPDVAPCSLNTVSLLMILLVAVVQAVVNALLSVVVNKVGRRNMTIYVTVICGVSGIIVNLISNAYASVSFFIIFQIGLLVMGLYSAIVVALFPTHLRGLALAFTITGGQIGSFVSVQIINLLLEVNCAAGLYLFSSIFVASSVIVAILPDERRLQNKILKREDSAAVE